MAKPFLSFKDQIEKLENHLNKQDAQYDEIIKLLKDGGIYDRHC